jgi:hypothetical protein
MRGWLQGYNAPARANAQSACTRKPLTGFPYE